VRVEVRGRYVAQRRSAMGDGIVSMAMLGSEAGDQSQRAAVPEFEIEISSSGDRSYRIAARSAAGETAATVVPFPFDDQALNRNLQAVEFAVMRSAAETMRRLAQ